MLLFSFSPKLLTFIPILYHYSSLIHMQNFKVCFHLTFAGDKLERVAEYSKSGHPFLWAVVYELMTQSVSTFSTQNLQTWNTDTWSSCVTTWLNECIIIVSSDLERSQTLHHLGDAVLSYGVGESRPRRRVGELWPTGEEWMVAIGAHVHTWGEDRNVSK